MRLKYRKDTKKCPRCNEKMLENQKVCPDCGLVFSKLDKATNAEAKKQFFQKDKAVVMVKDIPKDISKKKLLLLCGFLGIFGAHNFYVGRYYKAIFMFIFGFFSLLYVAYLSNFQVVLLAIEGFLSIPIGFVGLFWIFDFIAIIFENYKIPVGLRREA